MGDSLVEMQKHRDAWRGYAYGRQPRPQDFLDGNMVESDRGPTRIEQLEAAIAVMQGERDALQQQAEIHAQEARSQRATVHEIYQIATQNRGEPGDWNGAAPVRVAFATLRDSLAAARLENERLRDALRCHVMKHPLGTDTRPTDFAGNIIPCPCPACSLFSPSDGAVLDAVRKMARMLVLYHDRIFGARNSGPFPHKHAAGTAHLFPGFTCDGCTSLAGLTSCGLLRD